MSSTELMTEHDTQSPSAATVDAKLGCHPERSEGSACRLKAAPASRVPARRYAPRDDNRSLSGLVRVQQLMLVSKTELSPPDPEIPRRSQIWIFREFR